MPTPALPEKFFFTTRKSGLTSEPSGTLDIPSLLQGDLKWIANRPVVEPKILILSDPSSKNWDELKLLEVIELLETLVPQGFRLLLLQDETLIELVEDDILALLSVQKIRDRVKPCSTSTLFQCAAQSPYRLPPDQLYLLDETSLNELWQLFYPTNTTVSNTMYLVGHANILPFEASKELIDHYTIQNKSIISLAITLPNDNEPINLSSLESFLKKEKENIEKTDTVVNKIVVTIRSSSGHFNWLWLNIFYFTDKEKNPYIYLLTTKEESFTDYQNLYEICDTLRDVTLKSIFPDAQMKMNPFQDPKGEYSNPPSTEIMMYSMYKNESALDNDFSHFTFDELDNNKIKEIRQKLTFSKIFLEARPPDPGLKFFTAKKPETADLRFVKNFSLLEFTEENFEHLEKCSFESCIALTVSSKFLESLNLQTFPNLNQLTLHCEDGILTEKWAKKNSATIAKLKSLIISKYNKGELTEVLSPLLKLAKNLKELNLSNPTFKSDYNEKIAFSTITSLTISNIKKFDLKNLSSLSMSSKLKSLSLSTEESDVDFEESILKSPITPKSLRILELKTPFSYSRDSSDNHKKILKRLIEIINFSLRRCAQLEAVYLTDTHCSDGDSIEIHPKSNAVTVNLFLGWFSSFPLDFFKESLEIPNCLLTQINLIGNTFSHDMTNFFRASFLEHCQEFLKNLTVIYGDTLNCTNPLFLEELAQRIKKYCPRFQRGIHFSHTKLKSGNNHFSHTELKNDNNYSVDAAVSSNTENTLNSTRSVTPIFRAIRSDSHPHPAIYRLNVYDRVCLWTAQNPLILESSERIVINPKNPITFHSTQEIFNQTLTSLEPENTTHLMIPYYANTELTLTRKWQPLPGLSPNDIIRHFFIFGLNLSDFEVFYCEKFQQYVIRTTQLKEHLATCQFILESKPSSRPEKNTPLESEVLFFRSFESGALVLDESDITAKAIINQMEKQKKGSCVQRSALFFYQYDKKYLNQLRVVENGLHAFIEKWDPIRKEWIYCELGGYPVSLDIKPPPPLPTNSTPISVSTSTSNSSSSSISSLSSSVNSMPTSVEKSTTIPKQIPSPIKVEKFSSEILEFLEKISLNTLMTFDTLENTKIGFFSIRQHCLKKKIPVFCIHTAEDLHCLKKQLKINEHNMGEIVPGPTGALYDFLKNSERSARSILLIDLTLFLPEDLVRCNDLLDQRKFDGVSLPLSLQLVALTEKKNYSDDVKTRFHQCFDIKTSPSQEMKNEFSTTVTTLDNNAVIDSDTSTQIKLYHRPDWQTLLWGELRFQSDGIHYLPGALLQAIETGKKNLILENAPWELPKFQSFIETLLITQECSFYGKMIKLPKDFKILRAENSYDFSNEINSSDHIDKIIGRFNFRTLFGSHEFNVIHNSTDRVTLNHRSGLLIDFKNRPLHLYVTSFLSNDEWGELLDASKQHHIQLKISVAPGIKTPPTLSVTRLETPLHLQPATFAKLQVTQEEITDPKIFIENADHYIDCRSLSVSDLFGTIKKDDTPAEKNIFTFIQSRGSLSERLARGKTVVLYGHFSEELIDCLTHFCFTKRNFPGKLYLLTRENQSLQFHAWNATSIEPYRAQLLTPKNLHNTTPNNNASSPENILKSILGKSDLIELFLNGYNLAKIQLNTVVNEQHLKAVAIYFRFLCSTYCYDFYSKEEYEPLAYYLMTALFQTNVENLEQLSKINDTKTALINQIIFQNHKKFFYTASRKNILLLPKICLMTRANRPKNSPFRGFLFEGPSATGKSEAAEALLIEAEFSEIPPPSSYCELRANTFFRFPKNLSEAEQEKLLTQTAKAGAAVIIEESNSFSIPTDLLKKLLDDYPNFFLILTQNTASEQYQGRKILSAELEKRLIKVTFPAYTKEEIKEISQHRGCKNTIDGNIRQVINHNFTIEQRDRLFNIFKTAHKLREHATSITREGFEDKKQAILWFLETLQKIPLHETLTKPMADELIKLVRFVTKPESTVYEKEATKYAKTIKMHRRPNPFDCLFSWFGCFRKTHSEQLFHELEKEIISKATML